MGRKIWTPFWFTTRHWTSKKYTDLYFSEIKQKAVQLFEASFTFIDEIVLVYRDFKYKRRKIHFHDFTFKQIGGLKRKDVEYDVERRLYEPNELSDVYNRALVTLPLHRICFKNVLAAIAVRDYPPRTPRLDKRGILSSVEIFFVNTSRHLIFNMYDDRGIDILFSDIETLKQFQLRFKNWIIEIKDTESDNWKLRPITSILLKAARSVFLDPRSTAALPLASC